MIRVRVALSWIFRGYWERPKHEFTRVPSSKIYRQGFKAGWEDMALGPKALSQVGDFNRGYQKGWQAYKENQKP